MDRSGGAGGSRVWQRGRNGSRLPERRQGTKEKMKITQQGIADHNTSHDGFTGQQKGKNRRNCEAGSGEQSQEFL